MANRVCIRSEAPGGVVAGDKAGANQKRFYEQLIKAADERFDAHLEKFKQEKAKPGKG